MGLLNDIYEKRQKKKAWEFVKSSNIDAVNYFNKELRIRFKSSGVYVYHNVPKKVFDKFMAAPSIGKYYSNNIKGKYDGEKYVGEL
jgi:hypothetical protein